MRHESDFKGVKFAVIIASRNRSLLLQSVLSGIAQNTILPTLVVVVDSSDTFSKLDKSLPFNLVHLYTDVKSAAIQRNIAFQKIIATKININFVSILDDDIEIDSDYFEKIIKTFSDYPAAIGVSGITNDPSSNRRTFSLENFAKIVFKPGKLTRSAINLSPKGIYSCTSVDWLIGCSTWRRELLTLLRFESDFQGQSIFEDVIFSARAKKYGLLIVNPNIKIGHKISEIGRPNIQQKYSSWIENRYRIFSYKLSNLSELSYWCVNLLILMHSICAAVVGNNQAKEKSRGICRGIKVVILKRLVL